MKLLLLAAVLTGTGISEFRGASRLATAMESEAAEFLVYANNANSLGVLSKGVSLPLGLDTRLLIPGSCCSHRATPSLSLDGQHLAFVRLAAGQPRREAVTIYDLGSKSQKTVFEAEVVWSVSWAPQGDRVAVVADRAPDMGHNLYIVGLASDEVNQLSHGSVPVNKADYTVSNHAPPSWNGAGTQLAVEVRSARAKDDGASLIVIWDIEGNQLHQLTDGVDPAWSPAGDTIAFFEKSRQKCFTIRADGGERKLLFALGKKPFASQSAPLFYPIVWSPDGGQLIFHQWVDADLITDIYKLNVTSRRLKLMGRSELQVVNWRMSR
jgi:Tol biopolymer transport system component